MIAVLQKKASPTEIEVVHGDYVSARLDRKFSVVAIVFNNVFDPRGMQAQIDLFSNAAWHLEIGGYFIVEAFVLGDSDRDGTWSVSPRYVGAEHVELQLTRFDIETNTLERTLVHLRRDGPTFVTVKDAYASPRELDLIAHVTGFKRARRYANWSGAPFTADCRRHVSIYQRDR